MLLGEDIFHAYIYYEFSDRKKADDNKHFWDENMDGAAHIYTGALVFVG